ncbi:hypothetical protein MF271_03910 [Deinococcus sp. KNUC1210]|uniref:DUF6630 family protein n=1 Tax=Deinococcus sp. KNUC1210 TaxID=2917691 RepID=UPI001EF1144C|nr:hypothetical protein [Deinococcus sp. KNUC1210]ULH15792.1 hypothetical protein MF271_03910 [Deinococcus sp. KNUC1210]
MTDLLALILTPLTPELNTEIRRRFQQPTVEVEGLYALCEALQDVPSDDFLPGWWLDAAVSRFWLCLHVDWKASDEVEWQVQAIARSLHLPGTFVSAVGNSPRATTPDVLTEAAAWLRRQGYELLALDTGGDEYLSVPIRLDLLRQALTTADQSSLSTSLY